MTWEETIEHIRTNNNYKSLVENAYFSANLESNVEKYRNSSEFKETLSELSKLKTGSPLKILDLGAGNGISTISLALEGHSVTALEPDKSDTIGAGAIKILKEKYQLNNVDILECYAEDIPKEKSNYDVVFARQAMHHAYHLDNFIAAAYGSLNQGGILFTVRDHVVESPREKELFFKNHPLHKYYGGENAFSIKEYRGAMEKAGFKIKKVLTPSQSPINYHPWNVDRLNQKLGFISKLPFVSKLAWTVLCWRWNKLPGRLYSFIALK